MILDAAHEAGIDINVPCGGQGRCGRCAVIVERGDVRKRSTLRLSARDLEQGYALACQTVIEGDCVVTIPPQEEITRHLTTEKTAAKIALPFAYDAHTDQSVRKYLLEIEPPSLDDNTDDWARVQRTLRACGVENVTTSLAVMRTLARVLRAADWRVTAVVEHANEHAQLLDLVAGDTIHELYGAAVDIGTTTVTVYLVDLLTGDVVETAADYNAQIKRGEDVISRIVFASKNGHGGLDELNQLVVGTINRLVETCARRRHISTDAIYKMTVVGNSTMMHILLKLPPDYIRLAPYTTTANFPPRVLANELGLKVNAHAVVQCLPGISSFVGADITAGVLSSGTFDTDKLTLFLDIGTNGEMVLGNRDWLISCACSAGPAFEGAGVEFGMRATTGAIEEVWLNSKTHEPTLRVIGNAKPRGLCGSGLISLLAEMFITGVTDKAGHIVVEGREGAEGAEGKEGAEGNSPSPVTEPALSKAKGHPSRTRMGEHGPEYVVVWANESAEDRDIVITQVDIDNLLRAKAAIYAGYQMLAHSVGVNLADVEQILIGGSFGQYINVEKAVEIGLLPDVPWERFHFLGNTAARGAYMALLKESARVQVQDIARKLTYLELAADNAFTDQFLAAMFLPHTDLTQFPSVERMLVAPEQVER
ncbi:MAG: DUF4445 domain-containing protein [Chloroflexi bacterium]|nr:DUF4445 domain-containing protein [Chloroflexota bacterium]